MKVNCDIILGLFVMITMVIAQAPTVLLNNVENSSQLSDGDIMGEWIKFAQGLGVESNAAVIDIIDTKVNNSTLNIRTSLVLAQYRELTKQMTQKESDKKEKRQCFSCPYAGFCVNTCSSSGPSKEEERCTRKATNFCDIDIDNTGNFLQWGDPIKFACLDVSFPIVYLACLFD